MKIERLVSACAAFAIATGLAATGKAEVVTATYQGVVNDGFDYTGVFGVAGSNLAGDKFTVVYTINDAVSAYYYYDKSYSVASGGTDTRDESPVSATITINGVTLPISGIANGEVQQYTVGAVNNYTNQVYDYAATNDSSFYAYNSIASSTDVFVTSGNFTTPLNHVVQKNDGATGYFYEDINGGGSVEHAYATLLPTSLVIADVVGIPEPATWVLLILGVAMIGFTARRRRADAALAA